LYVHAAKRETLGAAYEIAKKNNGAPGIDGVTFAAIAAGGVEGFLAQRRDELVARTYRPLRNRRVEIPKRGGTVRVLGIPAIRDRVVQGALTLIMEPIFEADFCDGSYGYRPQRTAHEAVARVAQAIVSGKTRVIDVDLAARHGSAPTRSSCPSPPHSTRDDHGRAPRGSEASSDHPRFGIAWRLPLE
jgi:RNA-directed DNA polymerase